eukprot:COSAG06_NODE_48397_length_332_cov_0.914163_1_plen_24_part_10
MDNLMMLLGSKAMFTVADCVICPM